MCKQSTLSVSGTETVNILGYNIPAVSQQLQCLEKIHYSMTAMSDAVDMEQFNNCLKLTTTQILLRYVSECDPLNKRSKGGYLEGRVDVPFRGQTSPYRAWLRLSAF